jgi:FkbM family methyltransferase
MITVIFGDEDRMVTLPVLTGPAQGLRIRVDLVGRKDAYFWGKYDRYILDQVLPLVQPGWTVWTVWDCGAYLGYYSLIFARRVGSTGRVVAIELDRRNLKRTRENAEHNRIVNIEFVNVAIGSPAGEVEFVVDDGTNSHLSGTYTGGFDMKPLWRTRDKAKNRDRVECISLDQAVLDRRLPQPNLIKVDIEGAEKDALEHADYMFSQLRPLLLLELHNPECDKAAWNFSRRFDYELTSLNTGAIFTKAEQVQGTLLCRPR